MIGDESFFSLLKDWVAEHSGGSVPTEHLRAFAAARTDVEPDALAGLFDAWMDRTELPALP